MHFWIYKVSKFRPEVAVSRVKIDISAFSFLCYHTISDGNNEKEIDVRQQGCRTTVPIVKGKQNTIES